MTSGCDILLRKSHLNRKQDDKPLSVCLISKAGKSLVFRRLPAVEGDGRVCKERSVVEWHMLCYLFWKKLEIEILFYQVGKWRQDLWILSRQRLCCFYALLWGTWLLNHLHVELVQIVLDLYKKISTQKCWVTIGKHFDTFNNVNSQEIIYKYHRDVFQNNVWYAVGLTRLPSLPGRGSVVLGRGGRTGEGQGNEWWPQDCVQGQLWQFGEELDGFVYFIWSRASWENTVCLR